MSEKTCNWCSRLFIVSTGEKCFCSQECRIIYSNYQKNYNKEYQRLHKEQIKTNRKKRNYKQTKESIHLFRIKYYLNPKNKIVRALRARISLALKRDTKSGHSIELLGCSIEYLKNHLEKQFTSGMSWDNYGKWHIDHIKQCCTFDLRIPEQQKSCFNYTNLRPLWAKDNQERPKYK